MSKAGPVQESVFLRMSSYDADANGVVQFTIFLLLR